MMRILFFFFFWGLWGTSGAASVDRGDIEPAPPLEKHLSPSIGTITAGYDRVFEKPNAWSEAFLGHIKLEDFQRYLSTPQEEGQEEKKHPRLGQFYQSRVDAYNKCVRALNKLTLAQQQFWGQQADLFTDPFLFVCAQRIPKIPAKRLKEMTRLTDLKEGEEKHLFSIFLYIGQARKEKLETINLSFTSSRAELSERERFIKGEAEEPTPSCWPCWKRGAA